MRCLNDGAGDEARATLPAWHCILSAHKQLSDLLDGLSGRFTGHIVQH